MCLDCPTSSTSARRLLARCGAFIPAAMSGRFTTACVARQVPFSTMGLRYKSLSFMVARSDGNGPSPPN